MAAVLAFELQLDNSYAPHGVRIGRNAMPTIDKTSDAGDRDYLRRLDDARTRHRNAMNAMEMGDIACDERLVDAWRRGDVTVLGMVLADLVEERIESVARRVAS